MKSDIDQPYRLYQGACTEQPTPGNNTIKHDILRMVAGCLNLGHSRFGQDKLVRIHIKKEVFGVMLLYILFMILSYSVGLLGILACFFLIASVKPVKVSADQIPRIIEITVAIYKYTIIIALVSMVMVSAALFNISGYKNNSLEVIYFTVILVLILFQIFKKPEYPIAN